MGSDIEMLALCLCLAGICVRERRFGAFGVVKCCNDGPDAVSCGWLRHVLHATGIKGIYLGSAEPSWIGRGV